MNGPYLAGLPNKGFSGKSSAITTPVPGVPKVRSGGIKPVEKIKMKGKNKPLFTK